MEELYLLLAERGANIDTISFRLADLMRTLQDKANEGKITPFAKTQEGLEFSRFINQMKRTEKVRLIKENDLIDIVYGIKNFDLTQSHRFQEVSHEIMRKMRKDFNYQKIKDAPNIKDLATLYLQFFIFTDMKTRVEDLKRVYVDHKLPIVSVLAKWLVELSRDYFKDILNNFVKEYEVYNPPPVPKIDKIEKMPQKMTSPKGGRVLKSSKEQKGPESTDSERPPMQESHSAVNLTKKPVKKQAEPGDSNLKIEKIRPYLTDTSPMLDTLTVSQIQLPRQTPSTVAASPMTTLNTTPSSKQLDSVIVPAAPLVKKRSPFIQVKVNLSGQNAVKNYECLEDLDPSCTVMLNQLVGVSKAVKKLKGKNTLTIDTDKKREAIIQTYKVLYMQNSGVEKVISNYQTKSWQRANIDIPTSKKGDGFLEDYTVDYFERFYQGSNQTPRHENILKSKPKIKKPKGPQAIYNNPLEIKRPLTGSSLLRRARSNGSAHPLAQKLNESHAQSETAENRVVHNNPQNTEPLSGKENRFTSKIEAIMSESNSENYFRILKISNFLHKVPPKNQKNHTDSEKLLATEPSFSTPHITEMLTENFSNLAQSIPSQDRMSPTGTKRLTQLGPYLKKLINDEDDLSGLENTNTNTNMSVSISKIKAGRLLIQPDQSKRTPVEFEKQFSLDQLIIKDTKDAKDKSCDYNLFKGIAEASKLKSISKTRGIPAEPDYVLKGGRIFREKACDSSEMYNFKGSSRNTNEPSLKIFVSFEREVKVEDVEKKRRDTEGDSDKSEVMNGRKSHKHRKLLKTNQTNPNSAKNLVVNYE